MQGDERASRETKGQGRRVKMKGKRARTQEDKKGQKRKSRQTGGRKCSGQGEGDRGMLGT